MYIINTSRIQTGDILLSRYDNELSLRIRETTNSQYSHAFIYVGNYSIIESDGDGVQSNNIQRLLFKKTDEVIVLRLNGVIPVPALQTIVTYARRMIGMQYSMREAFKVPQKPTSKAAEENRQFCTRFVARAYFEAGIKLVENVDYCSPEDFTSSPLLENISDILEEATAEQIDFAQSNSILEKQNLVHNKILSNCRKLAGSDIQNFEDIAKYVLNNPEKDLEVTRIIEESGYFEMWKEEKQKNQWQYSIELFKNEVPDELNRFDCAMQILIASERTMERFASMLAEYKKAYSLNALNYFKSHIELYSNLIEMSQEKIKTCHHILGK
jgi:hypothetical protein